MFHIKYPNVNDEILNLDWILTKVKEMDETLSKFIEGGFEEAIDEYFNKVMVEAIYHEDIKQIELKKELVVNDGIHVYDAGSEVMSIDD